MPTAVVGLRNVLPTPPATATANGTGDATFTFSGTPSVGTWWYACCTVPLAPATAEFVLSLSGTAEAAWVGPQASSAVVVIAGTKVTVAATKLTPGTTYVAQLRGGWETGEPQGIPLSGPSSFTVANVENITIETVNAVIVPVVDTVGVYTGRRPLTGTTTPVPIIPPTRSETYFSHLKIGWAVWGDVANTGTYIYIGDSAGSTPLDWARIPAGSGNLIGEFNVAWGNAWVARVTGKAGDVVNVWAAQVLGGPSVRFSGGGAAASTTAWITAELSLAEASWHNASDGHFSFATGKITRTTGADVSAFLKSVNPIYMGMVEAVAWKTRITNGSGGQTVFTWGGPWNLDETTEGPYVSLFDVTAAANRLRYEARPPLNFGYPGTPFGARALRTTAIGADVVTVGAAPFYFLTPTGSYSRPTAIQSGTPVLKTTTPTTNHIWIYFGLETSSVESLTIYYRKAPL